jgi:hypothetical protein
MEDHLTRLPRMCRVQMVVRTPQPIEILQFAAFRIRNGSETRRCNQLRTPNKTVTGSEPAEQIRCNVKDCEVPVPVL